MVAALGVLRRKSFLLSVAGAQPTPELQHTCSRLQWLASATPDPQPSRVDLSRRAVSSRRGTQIRGSAATNPPMLLIWSF